MHVLRVEMSRLRRIEEGPLYAADMRLHLIDDDANPAGHVALVCHAEGSQDEDRRSLAQKMVADAQRQMSRMPEYRLGQNRLDFPMMAPQPMAA